MDVMEAAKKRRSVRAFDQKPIPREVLSDMVEAGRIGPSGANRQPLEYIVVNEPGLCQEVYDCLKWAAYIAPAGDPPEGKRPTAYLVILHRTDLALPALVGYDVGAAAAAAILVGISRGVASCWLKSINLPKITAALAIPDTVQVEAVIALGYPAEEPMQVDLKPQDEGLEVIRYWRDDNNQHFVPKRALDVILSWQRYGE